MIVAVLAMTACTARTSHEYASVEEQARSLSPGIVDESRIRFPFVGLGIERPRLDWAPAPDVVDGLERLAYTEGTEFVLQTSGGDRTFLPGVNLGSTIPGRAPGEVAVPAEEYRRWFPVMAEMGFRVVRIYTILNPEFYEELERYNRQHPDEPLYLMHGIWVPEEEYYLHRDLFHPDVIASFTDEITDAVAVVHGDAVLPDRDGHASGRYRADVTEWLIGWLPGVEWEPDLIHESDIHNEGREQYRGEFFRSTEDATPTEIWLAQHLDHLAALHAERGGTVPIGIVNWPTTDPVAHPYEPEAGMRLTKVDGNNVRPTDRWPGGTFASYHVYPYYPDFIHIDPDVRDFAFRDGTDPYAGYLNQLAEHHFDMPFLVTEFGVPGGMGLARREERGRSQGNLSEQQQMAVNADLMSVIHELDLAGAFSFEWLDEWFKLTWNTVEYELPTDRRPHWKNMWTNESHFGIVTTEPGNPGPTVIIDGDDVDWTSNRIRTIHESSGAVRRVEAVHDAAFLYLLLELSEPDLWHREAVVIGLDVIDGEGGGLPDGSTDLAADYAVVIGPGQVGEIMVRPDNDQYVIRQGLAEGHFDVDPVEVFDRPATWNPQRLIVRRPGIVPATGEVIDHEFFQVGDLRFGVTDPTDADFDSRSAWNGRGTILEIRLPHMAIGFSDPSSRQALVVLPNGELTTETVETVGITGSAGGELHQTDGYVWPAWDDVEWHQRLKVGAEMLADQIWEILETE